MRKIPIGANAAINLRLANRHGLVTGATGTGKTVTLQTLAEGFSAAGVPVFAADIKGDLSGVAAPGSDAGPAADRARQLGIARRPRSFPVRFWDIAGRTGLPVRITVHEMGPTLLARLLDLNETQTGVLNVAFKWIESPDCPIGPSRMMDIGDLRSVLGIMLDHAAELRERYGNVTPASVGAIQRSVLILEAQGGDLLFGEPALDINELLALAPDGRGIINLLSAENLMETPRVYGAFMLYLLTRLFDVLPEVGDLEKPKLVFFFDEAHLLFATAPRRLMEQIERLVRLIRSKGVGVYFVSQSPLDVPDSVAAQLNNKVQHALRAHTPKALAAIKRIAQTLRPNPAIKTLDALNGLGVGEALVSTLQVDGSPGMVQLARVIPPSAQIGPISVLERERIIRNDPLHGRYARQLSKRETYQVFIERVWPERSAPTRVTKRGGFWSRLFGRAA